MIEINEFDLIAITEWWLQADQDWELNILGCSMLVKVGKMGIGSGVAMLMESSIIVVLS